MKNDGERNRLSIDVFAEEHKQIKVFAAIHGETIREYVMKSVRERLRREKENTEMDDMVKDIGGDELLMELWDNDKDAEYDKL